MKRGILKGNGREWAGVVSDDGMFVDDSGDMVYVKLDLPYLTEILGFTFEPEEMPIQITLTQFASVWRKFSTRVSPDWSGLEYEKLGIKVFDELKRLSEKQ